MIANADFHFRVPNDIWPPFRKGDLQIGVAHIWSYYLVNYMLPIGVIWDPVRFKAVNESRSASDVDEP